MRIWRVNYLILAIAILHMVWAVILLFSDTPLHTAPIAETWWTFNQYFASGFYAFVSTAALIGLFWPRVRDNLASFFFSIPQQYVLLTSMATVIKCIVRGAYADGYHAPRMFIFADQFFVIIICIGHACTIIDWHFLSIRARKENV